MAGPAVFRGFPQCVRRQSEVRIELLRQPPNHDREAPAGSAAGHPFLTDAMMIEAVLAANGFAEAAEWIHQPHVFGELKDLANRARKQAVGPSTEQTDSSLGFL